MNLLILLFGTVESYLDWSERQFKEAVKLFYYAVFGAGGLLLAGIATAYAGHEHPGQAMINVAGLALSLLLALCFWKLKVTSYPVTLTAQAIGEIAAKKIGGLKEEVKKEFYKLRNITAWITALALYAEIVPVYRNPMVSCVAATAIMAIVAISESKWFHSNFFRYVCAGGAGLTLLLSTLKLVRPTAADGIGDHAERAADWIAGIKKDEPAQRKPAPTASSPAAVPPKTGGADVDLAPPENAPATPIIAQRSSSSQEPTAAPPRRRYSKEELDEVFSELDKYPDLR